MPKTPHVHGGLLSGHDLDGITEIFPKSLNRVVLVRLDRCARETSLPTVFALQTNLSEARRAFACYMDMPAFRKAFVRNFSNDIAGLLRELNGEQAEDTNRFTHDDFLSALSGISNSQNRLN